MLPRRNWEGSIAQRRPYGRSGWIRDASVAEQELGYTVRTRQLTSETTVSTSQNRFFGPDWTAQPVFSE